jgi:hypothetical protein
MPSRVLRYAFAAAMFAICAFPRLAAQTPQPRVAVLHSAGGKVQLSSQRVALAARLAYDQLNLSGEIPSIVVVLASKDSADVAEINAPPQAHGGAVQVELRNGHKIYYLWLLEEPTDELLARGVVRILADHSGRSGESLSPVISRVVLRLNAQVSRTDLQKDQGR